MAIATSRHEILDEQVEHGERHVRYRWTVTGGTSADGKPMPPSSGLGHAMERVEPMSRDLLLDRWNGLMGTDDWTELGEKLSLTLMEFSDGLTRRSAAGPDTVRIENDTSIGLDTVMDVDGLLVVIREWLIERAAKVAAA